jgi:hypothetical protein
LGKRQAGKAAPVPVRRGGNLVEEQINGGTARSYTTGEITKHYYVGSRRVAMRTPDGVRLLVGDHLGGTAPVTDVGGTMLNRIR